MITKKAFTKKAAALFASLLLLIALCIPAFAETGSADEEKMVFFDADTEKLVIIIPDTGSGSFDFASKTLQSYIAQITGETPEILQSSALTGAEADRVIQLAETSAETGAPAGSYTLTWGETARMGASVFNIDGCGVRGVINGVYGFLRKICGTEIFSADVKTVPESRTIESPFPYSYEYTPTLEYADTDWISPHDVEFALANGLNGIYSPLEHAHGGKVNYITFCHSLSTSIVPAEELFGTHPEYFALTERKGERETTQLCLSNPDVVERAKQDVIAMLDEKYDPEAALNIISVTQDDNQNYCVCENCSAIAEQYGGQSGLMIWFVNQIAEEVGNKYPDAVVDTFAYQYTRSAPTGIKPRDNVCVRLCTIEGCFSHALADPECERNAAIMRDLEDWSKLSNRLYVWDYVTNFANALGIFPNFGVLRQNIETFREHNVVGIYEEGAYYASECNCELFDLRAYLLSCLMRDEVTAEEEEELTRAFCEAYYGEGAGEMLDFVGFTKEHAGDDDGHHLGIYNDMRRSMHDVTEEDVKYVDGLFASALKKTEGAGNSAAAERIKRAELSWRYYKARTGTGEFRRAFHMANKTEVNQLLSDVKAMGITRFREGGLLEDISVQDGFYPEYWNLNESWLPQLTVPLVCALALLCLVTAVIAFIRKRHAYGIGLLLLFASALAAGIYSGALFVEWTRLALYAAVDAVMLLSVAGFCFCAFCARNGFRPHSGKRLWLSVFFSLLIAALPYELIVLLINTIIYHGLKPVFSITVSSYCQIAVIAAALIITAVSLKKDKEATK